MITVIYKIENKLTSDCYVGSSNFFEKRSKRHFNDLKSNKHHSIKLQRAFNKYGFESFIILKLESFNFISKEATLLREQYYIDLIKPKYNICLTAGSQLGSKRTDEFKKGCSKRLIGKPAWNKGLKTGCQSEETKEKRANSMRGRKISEETKKLISDKAKGRKFTEEHKLKLSKAKIKHGKYCRK